MSKRGLILAAIGVAALPWAARCEKKAQRKPDIHFVKVTSVRQEGNIQYEGDLKVTGEKPITGLVIQLDFFESRGVLLSIQKIEIDDGTLSPGEEKHFSVQGNDVPRAVSFRISARDRSGRDLNTTGNGPFALD